MNSEDDGWFPVLHRLASSTGIEAYGQASAPSMVDAQRQSDDNSGQFVSGFSGTCMLRPVVPLMVIAQAQAESCPKVLRLVLWVLFGPVRLWVGWGFRGIDLYSVRYAHSSPAPLNRQWSCKLWRSSALFLSRTLCQLAEGCSA